ncbi:tetratricopeptide repeat protein [Scytonema sp. HK-05]|uniref:tetratricopeptide repeat protein n=1 Tax=Scytonema sp. HK-05 TaxID=1137095 RepID=UPI0030DC4B34
MGDYDQAFAFHQQYLAIAQEIGDRFGEAAAMANLGETLIKLEQYLQAQEYLEVPVDICRKIGARFNEGQALKG